MWYDLMNNYIMLHLLVRTVEAADDAHLVASRRIIAKIQDVILFPLITLLMSIAFLIFVWGAFQYVMNAENDQARETGRKHMLFGIIGFVVMVSALSILKVATNTFGVTIPT